jgi:AAA domain (dynein-related subfamily)
METDQETALTALAIAISSRVPVLLWGGPGTGKSSAIRDLAEAMRWPCEVVIASIREPSDFAGLPVVIDSHVQFAPPRWARDLAAADDGILFLDEITTAPPAVQAALLRVVLERFVGDLPLPPGIAVVAAANPPDQALDGWHLSPPLANRFCHVDWTADTARFGTGMTAGWPKPPVPELPPAGRVSDVAARGLVAAFVNIRPALLSSMPREPEGAGRAWPSPRTWEMAARLYASCEEAGAPDLVRTALISGAVGTGAAVEFLTWVSEMDLGDPEDALQNPTSFELPERGDRAYAALSAIAAAVAVKPTIERWNAAWEIVATSSGHAPDIAAVAARILAGCRPEGAATPRGAERFAPILREAGLL